ncbi:MAG: response regulator, partial [Coleofasciculus sp. Co-bin14]|nr:response regulator [Coleofasciculus sp. Co-bin14]
MRILIIEDDELTAKALTTVLSNHNYAVEVATNGQTGWELVEAFAYDVILLDVVLPKLDGLTLCRQLRSHGYQMPILLLTGRDSSHDKAIGLDAGADDYLVKPFDPEELVARIRALLRRGSSTLQPVLEWGSLRLDPATCEVTYEERHLQLTPKEYALLELLLRNTARVFSCGVILEHLWSYGETPGEEAVRTHIKGLRHKLKTAGAPADLIETVYGIGYRLKPPETMCLSNACTKVGELNRQQTLLALAKVWNRFKGRISEQVEVIEQAVTALLNNTLGEELRTQAEHEAHTLAGSLGTFGFPEGSRVARKIERLLQANPSLAHKEVMQLRELVRGLRKEIERTPERSFSKPTAPKDER